MTRLQSTIIIADCNHGYGYGYGYAPKYESISEYRYGFRYVCEYILKCKFWISIMLEFPVMLAYLLEFFCCGLLSLS